MSAGLPGLGLGGLFFILTALLAPAIELVRTARGQSSFEAWRAVARQFAIAVAMIVAVDLTIRGALLAMSFAGAGDGTPDRGLTALPVALIGTTAALLATVLGVAKTLELCLRPRERVRPRVFLPIPRSLGNRAVPGTSVVAAVWLALLLVGAEELNSLPGDSGPGAPESAMAAKQDRADERRLAAHANPPTGGNPGAGAVEAGKRSVAGAETAETPSAAAGGTSSGTTESAGSTEGARVAPGGDAVAGEAPTDEPVPTPAPGATTSDGPSGGESPSSAETPPGTEAPTPGPPPHASAPDGLGKPPTAGSPNGA